MSSIELTETWRKLEQLRRPASIATLGGFRPPTDPRTSWFGRGTRRPGEALPLWNGIPMAPLLQVRVNELPIVPERLRETAMLVLFHCTDRHVFDAPHGEGWLIREYADLSDLQPLPEVEAPWRSFPVSWRGVDDDMPGWSDAWSLLDLTAVNEDENASDRFFSEFQHHEGTKIGGYPFEVQHGAGVADFVFQVDTEPKAGWMWGDQGVGYFHAPKDGPWRMSCQFL